MILSPALFFGAIETGLRLFKAGYPARFYVETNAGQEYRDNEKFVWQFYSPKTQLSPQPFLLAARKPAGTIRIFILGESAAMGTPDPSYGFGRILERMLRRRYPRRKFEVINAAVRGINSHVVLPIAKDCAQLAPDLFIAYAGNNEIVGLHAPGPHAGYLTPHLNLLRAVQWINSSRLGQMAGSVLDRARSPHPEEQNQDLVFFREHRLAADDPRRMAVYGNFRANLEDACAVIGRSRAKLILCTVPVNLKDCPPLGSLHRADLAPQDLARWEAAYAAGIAAENRRAYEQALRHYLAAARLDDHFADLHFRIARSCFACGRFDSARRYYQSACDWDAMAFRSNRQINRIIREVAAGPAAPGIHLVDAEKAFAESDLSDHKIPGQKLFYEHVHLKFDGDYLLARTLYPAVVAALSAALGEPDSQAQIPSREECLASLALTPVNEAQVLSSMAKLTSQPPFTDQIEHSQRQEQAERMLTNRFGLMDRQDVERAIHIYRAALQQTPDDWQLHFNFGRFFFTLHDYSPAVEEFEIAEKLLPRHTLIRVGLSGALARSGKLNEAIRNLEEILKSDSDAKAVRETLNALREQKQAEALHPAR